MPSGGGSGGSGSGDGGYGRPARLSVPSSPALNGRGRGLSFAATPPSTGIHRSPWGEKNPGYTSS